MSKVKLLLRCYAEKSEGQWQAICIDLNLAAQADTLEEAKAKLREQASEYIYDAIAGDDREFASELLNRKAPLEYRLKYYYCVALSRLHAAWSAACSFPLSLPMVPAKLAA